MTAQPIHPAICAQTGHPRHGRGEAVRTVRGSDPRLRGGPQLCARTSNSRTIACFWRADNLMARAAPAYWGGAVRAMSASKPRASPKATARRRAPRILACDRAAALRIPQRTLPPVQRAKPSCMVLVSGVDQQHPRHQLRVVGLEPAPDDAAKRVADQDIGWWDVGRLQECMKVASHGAGRVPTARRRVAPADPARSYTQTCASAAAPSSMPSHCSAVGERRYDDDGRRSVTRVHQVKAMGGHISTSRPGGGKRRRSRASAICW